MSVLNLVLFVPGLAPRDVDLRSVPQNEVLAAAMRLDDDKVHVSPDSVQICKYLGPGIEYFSDLTLSGWGCQDTAGALWFNALCSHRTLPDSPPAEPWGVLTLPLAWPREVGLARALDRLLPVAKAAITRSLRMAAARDRSSNRAV